MLAWPRSYQLKAIVNKLYGFNENKFSFVAKSSNKSAIFKIVMFGVCMVLGWPLWFSIGARFDGIWAS